MIFADKLIALRKKAGYSQEELAQQLNVTRHLAVEPHPARAALGTRATGIAAAEEFVA